MVKQHPNTNLLDFEKAKMNGQVLTSLDEARLRNTQLRAARKMYLNTMTLSEREPLLSRGPRGQLGTNWRDAGRLRSKFWRWQQQLGVTTLNKLTGGAASGYKPWRQSWYFSVLQRHGTRDFGLTLFRHFLIRGPVLIGFFWSAVGFWHYFSAWNNYTNVHGGLAPVGGIVRAPECLPEDDKVVARLNDVWAIRNGRGAQLKPDRKDFPLGTRYDWIEGKPVLPKDPGYYWIDGRPIRKDRGYLNPGPEEVMGKIAYAEDDFWGADGKPKKPSQGMVEHGHGHH